MSYETAAHRFTNLATHHLDIPVHFMRISAAGVIYKAYENDGVRFPTDATGAIEGQRVCRYWTARTVFHQPDLSAAYQQYTDTVSGTYWCTSVIDRTPDGLFSVSVGVPYVDVKWMRGRETTHRSASRCPDPTCCSLPPADLAARWDGQGLAERTGALAPARRDAARRLPRRRRHRSADVPRPARHAVATRPGGTRDTRPRPTRHRGEVPPAPRRPPRARLHRLPLRRRRPAIADHVQVLKSTGPGAERG